ncbi:MAG: outer membrane protein assembly factor BamE [Polaromonas sp.]|jgi:outer membrane protein assembly factor BamE|nr:outer membrane protein assembly factor BamE [Polaromonas sp.]
MPDHIATPKAMSAHHRSLFPAGLIISVCALLTACSSTTEMAARVITPFRADVVQGNFLSSEQVAMLRPGMSRAEVRNVLGTPLVTSVFHADRWDYVFTLKRQGSPDQSFRYAVHFKGEALERFEGDSMPTEDEFIVKLDKRRNVGKVPALEATPAQLEAAGSKAPAAAASAALPAAPAQPPVASYPPLESPLK